MVPPCKANGNGWGSADTSTGSVQILNSTSYPAPATFYYTGSSCTGIFAVDDGSSSTAVYTYGTNYYAASVGYNGGWGYTSYRNYGGSCGDFGYTVISYNNGGATSQPACGTGACKIK